MNNIHRLDKLGFIRALFFCLSLLHLICRGSYADTLTMKDGTKMKGLIIDEFKDRMVLSTVEGEKIIMKGSLRSVIYDNDEDALMKEGRNYEKRLQYIKAYYVYEKVLELNPTHERARQRLYYLKNYLEQKIREDIADNMERRKKLSEKSDKKTKVQEVAEAFGIVLASDGKYIYVKQIKSDTFPDAKSELKLDDRIVAVWGKETVYMDAEDVALLFLSSGEVRLKIERVIYPVLLSGKSLFGGMFGRYKEIIGASLKLRKEGIVINSLISDGSFEKVGIKKGDLLLKIAEKRTRYMSMPELMQSVESNRGKQIEVVIERDITLWKRSGRNEKIPETNASIYR